MVKLLEEARKNIDIAKSDYASALFNYSEILAKHASKKLKGFEKAYFELQTEAYNISTRRIFNNYESACRLYFCDHINRKEFDDMFKEDIENWTSKKYFKTNGKNFVELTRYMTEVLSTNIKNTK
jgi:hypothetical protein